MKPKIYTILFLLGILWFACNTPKDLAPPVPIFNANDLVGNWKLVAGSADIGGGAIVIPDIFDRTNTLLQADTSGFCSKGAVLSLLAGGTFRETSDCYQVVANKTFAGVYTFRQEAAAFALSYPPETKIEQRVYRITTLNTKEMKVNFSSTRAGITFISKLTYQKL